MVDPIICKFVWTHEESEKAAREASRLVVGPTIRWLAHFTAFALAAVLIWSMIKFGVSVTPVFFLAVIGYWYLVRPFEMRWWHRRRFAARPDSGSSIEWSANEEVLSFRVGDIAHSEIAWKALQKCVRVKEGFLLFTNEPFWHWLPDSGFASPEAASQFGHLAAEKSPKFENRA